MNASSVLLGEIGIWTAQFDYQPAARAQEAAAELEELGFGALWFPESTGREAFTQAGLLLARTSRIVVATGIANIYARDPIAAAAAQNTLAEAYENRFVLGLGVSHVPLVEQLRGHRYGKPVPTMRAYLDALDRAPYRAVRPSGRLTRFLAALGPKMLDLARERADGAHTYFVPPEHTRLARATLGPDRQLAVEQAVVLESNADKARRIARAHTSVYLKLANYTSNLRRLGFGDADLANDGSDRLVDSIVAWGTERAIVDRVREHLAAGATHVCLQLLPEEPQALPMAGWRELASALLRSR